MLFSYFSCFFSWLHKYLLLGKRPFPKFCLVWNFRFLSYVLSTSLLLLSRSSTILIRYNNLIFISPLDYIQRLHTEFPLLSIIHIFFHKDRYNSLFKNSNSRWGSPNNTDRSLTGISTYRLAFYTLKYPIKTIKKA